MSFHPVRIRRGLFCSKPIFAVAVAFFLIAALCVPASAGEGVFVTGNDALQLGRCGSGVASPRSSYWSFMNPAGMVDLERRLDMNFYAVYDKVTYKPHGLFANKIDGDLISSEFNAIASTGIILPLETGTLGGGIFVPSGNSIEYPHSRNIMTRLFQGNNDRRLAYQHLRGILAYAYEFDNGWSVGLGVHVSLSRFRSDHLTLGFRPAKYDNEWDDAWGAGLGIGLYRKWDRFAVGINYNPRHWVQSMKKYRDLLSHPLDSPQYIQAGIAYKVTPKVELTLDYRWSDWSSIAAYSAPIFKGGGFGWKDQHGVKAGVEWVAHPKWTFMAGYSYSNTPITEDNVFLATLVPVVLEHTFAAGVSHKINEKHQVHLIGAWAIPNTLYETGRGDLFSKLGKDSSLRSDACSAMLGYSYLW
jgi:long-chain fatty acid transport protein